MTTGRKPPRTRVISYVLDGDFDAVAIERLLARAQADNIVTQFDYTKSAGHGQDRVWFNGPPGKSLRELRKAVTALIRRPS